jgi:hypothetical protein
MFRYSISKLELKTNIRDNAREDLFWLLCGHNTLFHANMRSKPTDSLHTQANGFFLW